MRVSKLFLPQAIRGRNFVVVHGMEITPQQGSMPRPSRTPTADLIPTPLPSKGTLVLRRAGFRRLNNSVPKWMLDEFRVQIASDAIYDFTVRLIGLGNLVYLPESAQKYELDLVLVRNGAQDSIQVS